MPRPATGNKRKEKAAALDAQLGPLVVHEKSPYYFKAFLFPEESPDMIVDTSGDVFALTPEDAVKSLFDNMEQSLFMQIPDRLMYSWDPETDAEEEVEYDNTKTSKFMKYLVMIAVAGNWDEETIKAVEEIGDGEVLIRLKDLTKGYDMSMAEYTIDSIQVFCPNGSTMWRLQNIDMHVESFEKESPHLPMRITIKLPRK